MSKIVKLNIRISKKAAKFLKTVPIKHARQLKLKIEYLRLDAFPNDSKLLKMDNVKRYRVTAGEYRIIYHVKDNIIWLDLIGKRNDSQIYKEFKRLL